MDGPQEESGKSKNWTLMVQRSNFRLQNDSKLIISSIYVIFYPFLTIWKWVVWQKKNNSRLAAQPLNIVYVVVLLICSAVVQPNQLLQ